jgi:hypothetical protein
MTHGRKSHLPNATAAARVRCDLMKCRPDVIEELNFDDGFKPRVASPIARPTMFASASGEL